VVTLIGSTADQGAQTTGYRRTQITGFTSTPASGVMYVSYMNGTSGAAGGPFTVRGPWSQALPAAGTSLPPGNAGQFSGVFNPAGNITSPGSISPYDLSAASVGKLPFWFALD
jgi:hypothetical protein